MAQATMLRQAAEKRALRTWIVVADSGHARILESGHPLSGVTVRLGVTSDARRTAGKLAAGRLPRTQESGSPARHGIEPRVSLKEHERRVFTTRLADYLKGGLRNFDQLVLIAPTRFLNLLREAISHSVVKKILVVRDKYLTWMTDAQVLDYLGSVGGQVRRARERT